MNLNLGFFVGNNINSNNHYSCHSDRYDKSYNLSIKKFELDHYTKANYLIVGKHFYTMPIINDIIRDKRSIVITHKERQKQYNPETCKFYDAYDEFDVKKYIDNIKREDKQIPFYNRAHTYIVFDDCFYDSTWQENRALIELMKDPDNIFNTSVIITVSFPIGINPYMKATIDYMFVMSSVKKDFKMLYDRYFNFVPTYDLFISIAHQLLSRDEVCLVIINKESKYLNDCIKWYQLKNPVLNGS